MPDNFPLLKKNNIPGARWKKWFEQESLLHAYEFEQGNNMSPLFMYP
jgi:hypothetical protein